MGGTTLRSLCSVNDDSLVIRDMSEEDDDDRLELWLVRQYNSDRKYIEFNHYLKIDEVNTSLGMEAEFNKAIYGNRMLNFLAKHSKRSVLFYGSYVRGLLPNMKSSRICTYAKRQFATLNYMTKYTSKGETLFYVSTRLRDLSRK